MTTLTLPADQVAGWIRESLGTAIDPDAPPRPGDRIGVELIVLSPPLDTADEITDEETTPQLLSEVLDTGVEGGLAAAELQLPEGVAAGGELEVDYVAPLARHTLASADGTIVRPLGGRLVGSTWSFPGRSCRPRLIPARPGVVDGDTLTVRDGDRLFVIRPAAAGTPSGDALAAWDAYLYAVSHDVEQQLADLSDTLIAAV